MAVKKPVLVDLSAPGVAQIGAAGSSKPVAEIQVETPQNAAQLVHCALNLVPAALEAVPGADTLFLSVPTLLCSKRTVQDLRESFKRANIALNVRIISTAAALLLGRGTVTGCIAEGNLVSTIYEGGLFNTATADTAGIFDGIEIAQFQIKTLSVPQGTQFEGSKKLKIIEYDLAHDGFAGMSALASLAAWENAEDPDAIL